MTDVANLDWPPGWFGAQRSAAMAVRVGPLIRETMIRVLVSVAFALIVATSAEAMLPAPPHEPRAGVTPIARGQPCDLKNQVRIWGCPRCGAYGICMLRTTPRPVPQRAYRKCVEWNEGMCVEYDKTRR
jgi:hypothetical protein